VDDDPEDHLMLFDYFRDRGTEQLVRFLDNGLQAIKYLNDSPDSGLPRLIVLDLNMPILNGTQTLLQIKANARYQNIPVIIFSTSENEIEKRKCLNFGAIEYLVKPLTYQDGKDLVDKFISYIQ
jgi:CheY-like chemotaxis protein